jgi:pimeloyl-ACP methyl ester carboxylesterase
VLPAFVRQRAGVIVNVSSLLGSVASPTTACYGASKAALESWTFALRAEVARFGVRASVFVAPHTDTETGRRVKFDGVLSVPVAYTARELVRAICIERPSRAFLWQRALVEQRTLTDESESFTVTVGEAPAPLCTVLFAVGGGGDPERHLPLLSALVDARCSVVAPHFERMLSPAPTEEDLLRRARRLRLSLDSVARPGVRYAGVGHSIGTTMLIALAGGQVWLRAGRRLDIAADPRLERLALMAPATGFFQAPGALDAVHAPILAWAAANDPITPVAQAQFLKQALGARVPVEVRVVDSAGHFSFMNALPPQVTDSLPDRETFLAQLASELCSFVSG